MKRSSQEALIAIYFLVVVVVGVSVVFGIIKPPFEDIPLSYDSLVLDTRGAYTLIITIGFIIAFFIAKCKFPWEYLKNKRLSTQVFSTLLALSAFISFWVGIRTALLYIYRYLLTPNYQYVTTEIFAILAPFLITFGIVKIMISCLSKDDPSQTVIAKPILESAIYVTIVGLITTLPRSADEVYINSIGMPNFVILIVALTIIIAILVFISRKLLLEKE